MRRIIFIINLLILNFACFGQDTLENKSSIFFDGVHLEKPKYNFQWSFQINDIPEEKFINYQVDKKSIGVWTHIKFDSIFFNEFLLKRVIVKTTKKKGEEKLKMREFIGIVDFKTLAKMTTFFNYNWKGWIFYPKENPLYRFRFHKDKKEGFIVIERHSI